MFKVVVAFSALVAMASAQYSHGVYPYARPFAATQYTGYPQYTPAQVVITPTPLPAIQTYTARPPIPILRHDQETGGDGSYHYEYETANGIAAQEQGGVVNTASGPGSVAQGSYSYTSPEGKVISISYVADENGFRAVGDAIPTPPPVPPAIQRALAYIAAHPSRESVYEQGRYY
ncbi:hypothetical protein NQ318_011120 [Aromia moschata]|uniref:Uncharacterized protein n=1 Tax=Aromia moschata TaxID=1265417 RepID=A0AAV8YUP0_9CUCU|nr:hypothetical protein NQ318_011120 [Aromia moschata]